jgi:Holliday junction resolvase RusA-like endonuclease
MKGITDAQLRKAGATVKRIRIPEREPQQKLLPGTLLVQFEVQGRPKPWSVSRRGTKDPDLEVWQQNVASAGRKAHGLRVAYPHPVRLEMTFWLTTKPGRPPDDCNLRKSSEDALQSKYAGVIVDDSQVSGCTTRRHLNQPRDYATVSVYASD